MSIMFLCLDIFKKMDLSIYIYIYIHTHTHTYIHTFVYIVKNYTNRNVKV